MQSDKVDNNEKDTLELFKINENINNKMSEQENYVNELSDNIINLENELKYANDKIDKQKIEIDETNNNYKNNLFEINLKLDNLTKRSSPTNSKAGIDPLVYVT